MATLLKLIGVLGGVVLFLFLVIRFEEKKYLVVPEKGLLTQEVHQETSTTSVAATKKIILEKLPPVKRMITFSAQTESKVDIPLKKLSQASERQEATSTSENLLQTNLASSSFALLSQANQTLPPLDEEEILKAIVKIQCSTEDGLGKYIGSGFAIKDDRVITAAHVVKDSGSKICEVIFPSERRPVHYFRGTIVDFYEVKQRHDIEGIDVAILKLPPLESYPEGKAIFQKYPAVPYSICENPRMLEDRLLHFGYPSNYLDQSYLSRLEGKALVYADIKGIREQLSEDTTFVFKTPVFGYTYDDSKEHPYMVSQVASFYGDSGGLAFNADKQCIIGPHRGGTIGKASGENYSIFMNIGWEGVRELLIDE